MASNSVGQIGLDLVVNKGQFNKDLVGIKSMAKKAGAAIGVAFAIKGITNFAKSCLALGSDLQEVQNIADVAFPSMNAQMESFAQNAAKNFGLSETLAKRFSAMFGTMAKQFGFTEKEAFNMGTTLAGLAGDVASFYDMTQDEAYTKLKAVFSGETEVLKDIGVVMTHDALDSYALANGIGKVTQEMSEQEKVALRYRFVQNQLSAATGDFIRTQDSWANQTRVLKLQWDSFKASLGQGLINVFTPILKVINMLLGKLVALANTFKRFTEMVTGKKSQGASMNLTDTAGAAESVGTSADSAAGSVGNIGKAAKKTAKEIKKSLMGFDQINKVEAPQSDSDSSGSAGGLEARLVVEFRQLRQR